MLMTSVYLPSLSYGSAGQFTSQWSSVKITTSTNVSIPRGNWADIARVKGASSATPTLEMIRGERWITLGRDEVGMLGLTSGQAVDILKQFPGRSAQVFARYSPENAQLRITVIRVEPRPDGYVYMSRGDWTPHHGEFDRAYRHHLTDTEKLDRTLAGYNPFQAFRGSNTDPVFYNIDLSAALVAIGHAMRMNEVTVGWLAVSSSRLDVQTKESGNVFAKKVTTTVDGLVSPVWYLVTPAELQPYGGISSQICANPAQVVAKPGGSAGMTDCDDQKHIVYSGVVASEWSGGSMPSQEDNVYHWETSKSSLSILSYVIITFVLFWAGGAAFGAAAGQGATGAAVGAAAGSGTGAGLIFGTFSAAEFAGIAAGTYAAGSTGFGTNAGLTSAQGSYAGSTGSGVNAISAPTTEQDAGLRAGVLLKQIAEPYTSGLSATRQMFVGNCPESSTQSECDAAGNSAGVIYRADSIRSSNTVEEFRKRYKTCQLLGYKGQQLSECAAPSSSGTFNDLQ